MVVEADEQGIKRVEAKARQSSQETGENSDTSGIENETLTAMEQSLGSVEELASDLAVRLEELHRLQNKMMKALGRSNREKDRQMVLAAQEKMKGWNYLTPTPGGRFVRLFLGSHNVRFQRKKERMSFKEEYERFKQKCVPIFVAACVLCLIFNGVRWLHMLLQLLLAYYYVTLALRENVLDRNLHWYGLYNSILQLFQVRYQKARLYAMRALGKAGEMDVSHADSSVHVQWHEGMKLLIPLIVLGQGFQLYIAIVLFRIFGRYRSQPQILLCGLLFLAMFIGNLLTTAYTLREKAKGKTKSRRHTQ